MAWPTSQDYNEAIQNAETCLADAELRAGRPVVNALGMPLPRSGNFADVYEFDCPASGKRFAVKCFTREVPGLQERYSAIGKHLAQAQLSFMVDFQYLEQGIRVRGQWYPILKMRWVEGLLLNDFVRKYCHQRSALEQLSDLWLKMALRLREAGIAHGDLQHGNVILVPGEKDRSLKLRLIDYDGMFVPALVGRPSGEVGHPAYQHPERLRTGAYDGEVDRFSLLVIATALRALIVGGRTLWDRYDNGDNLLFKQQDLAQPGCSALLRDLWAAPDPILHALTGHLAASLTDGMGQAPLLSSVIGNNVVARVSVARERILQEIILGAVSGPVFVATPPTPVPQDSGLRVDLGESSWMRLAGLLLIVILIAGVAAFSIIEWKQASTRSTIAVTQEELAPEVPAAVIEASAKKNDKVDLSKLTKRDDAIEAEKREPPAARIPFDAKQARMHQEAWATYLGVPVEIMNTLGMKLVLIPPGSYMPASPGEDELKLVEVQAPIYIGVYEVTQEEYEKVMGHNPSWFSATGQGQQQVGTSDTRRLPVENVTWGQAVEFCNELSRYHGQKPSYPWSGETLGGYRLPKEAEWEFACRAGSPTNYFLGDGDETMGVIGWAVANSGSRTHTVGTRKPNPFGLYDMHGNVSEWCADLHPAGLYRVSRGGAWNVAASFCTAAWRGRFTPTDGCNDLGFRVALALKEPNGKLARFSQPSAKPPGTSAAPPTKRPEVSPLKTSIAPLITGRDKSVAVGGDGGSPFEDVRDNCLLRGFLVSTTWWSGNLVIQSIQPISRNSTEQASFPVRGTRLGPSLRVVAKEDYAVGGIVAKGEVD
jgi:formylglycine-generating enzyme required for sulfatase activity